MQRERQELERRLDRQPGAVDAVHAVDLRFHGLVPHYKHVSIGESGTCERVVIKALPVTASALVGHRSDDDSAIFRRFVANFDQGFQRVSVGILQ